MPLPQSQPYRSIRHRWYGRGFLRLNICGWIFKVIDRRKHHPVYSDRLHGWKVGRFVVVVRREGE